MGGCERLRADGRVFGQMRVTKHWDCRFTRGTKTPRNGQKDTRILCQSHVYSVQSRQYISFQEANSAKPTSNLTRPQLKLNFAVSKIYLAFYVDTHSLMPSHIISKERYLARWLLIILFFFRDITILKQFPSTQMRTPSSKYNQHKLNEISFITVMLCSG